MITLSAFDGHLQRKGVLGTAITFIDVQRLLQFFLSHRFNIPRMCMLRFGRKTKNRLASVAFFFQDIMAAFQKALTIKHAWGQNRSFFVIDSTINIWPALANMINLSPGQPRRPCEHDCATYKRLDSCCQKLGARAPSHIWCRTQIPQHTPRPWLHREKLDNPNLHQPIDDFWLIPRCWGGIL
jgi:hypothetical protein